MAAVKWAAADLPDLPGQPGRTIVVTGASSGIGLAAARELARAGARVVLAVRDPDKGQRVAAGIPGDTEVRPLDLASLASVRAFAAGWTGPLDVLVNNAGIMAVPEGRTADGFELQIGTNHLGPFLLTSLLLPAITDRVVTVSSQLHRRGRIDLADLNWEHRRYSATGAYNASKLANVLFTVELQRRLTEAGSQVRAVTAHPGIARTSLGNQDRTARAISRYLGWLFNDPPHGALPTLYAATQDIPGGAYIGPDGLGHLRGYPGIHQPSKDARDPEMARRLWDLSARLTGAGSGELPDGLRLADSK
jgi:NAD(P)-dependent dehydrogenase (short-subunit alcohol dehydrogenase family)